MTDNLERLRARDEHLAQWAVAEIEAMRQRVKDVQAELKRINALHHDCATQLRHSCIELAALKAQQGKPIGYFVNVNALTPEQGLRIEQVVESAKDDPDVFPLYTIESLIADGWRQCAKGQGESQYCGMLEAEKAKAYAKGVEDMRERAAKLIEVTDLKNLPDEWKGFSANILIQYAAAIRALPIEGEQG